MNGNYTHTKHIIRVGKSKREREIVEMAGCFATRSFFLFSSFYSFPGFVIQKERACIFLIPFFILFYYNINLHRVPVDCFQVTSVNVVLLSASSLTVGFSLL